MDNLLNKSNINDSKLKSFYLKRVATEISALSEPCYYPKLKKDYFDLLHICKLTDKDVKDYVKSFYKGTPASNWLLHKDPITNLNIFLMYYFLKKKDMKSYRNLMIYYFIRIYTNLINKQIKTCSKDAFKYALNNLSKNHLFYREKNISKTIFFMAKIFQEKYKKGIEDKNVIVITKFITEARHRISQSIKSFATIYYDAVATGKGIKEPFEGNDDVGSFEYKKSLESSGEVVIRNIVDNVCIYRYVDKQSKYKAITLSHIDKSLADKIVLKFANLKYKQDLITILSLFIKELKKPKDLCGKEFYSIIKTIIRTVKYPNNLQNSILLILTKVIKDIRYTKKYEMLNNSDKKNIYIFITLYISFLLRNKLC